MTSRTRLSSIAALALVLALPLAAATHAPAAVPTTDAAAIPALTATTGGTLPWEPTSTTLRFTGGTEHTYEVPGGRADVVKVRVHNVNLRTPDGEAGALRVGVRDGDSDPRWHTIPTGGERAFEFILAHTWEPSLTFFGLDPGTTGSVVFDTSPAPVRTASLRPGTPLTLTATGPRVVALGFDGYKGQNLVVDQDLIQSDQLGSARIQPRVTVIGLDGRWAGFSRAVGDNESAPRTRLAESGRYFVMVAVPSRFRVHLTVTVHLAHPRAAGVLTPGEPKELTFRPAQDQWLRVEAREGYRYTLTAKDIDLSARLPAIYGWVMVVPPAGKGGGFMTSLDDGRPIELAEPHPGTWHVEINPYHDGEGTLTVVLDEQRLDS